MRNNRNKTPRRETETCDDCDVPQCIFRASIEADLTWWHVVVVIDNILCSHQPPLLCTGIYGCWIAKSLRHTTFVYEWDAWLIKCFIYYADGSYHHHWVPAFRSYCHSVYSSLLISYKAVEISAKNCYMLYIYGGVSSLRLTQLGESNKFASPIGCVFLRRLFVKRSPEFHTWSCIFKFL